MIIIEVILKFLRMLKKSNIVEMIIALQVAILSVVVLLQVFFRYVLNYPLAWSEELSRFLLVWVVLLGAAIGVKRKSHFSIDIVFKKFPQKIQKNLQFAMDLFLFILIFDVMVLNGVYLANLTFRQISPALHLRVSYVYSAVLVGGILSCCYTLEDILLFIKSNLKKNRKGGRK